MNDARVLRDRSAVAQGELDRSDNEPPDTSAAVLAQTVTEATYPTVAGSFYACHAMDIDGDETEGAIASYVADSTETFYAFNLGPSIPPSGTMIIAHAAGGRWVFRYDG